MDITYLKKNGLLEKERLLEGESISGKNILRGKLIPFREMGKRFIPEKKGALGGEKGLEKDFTGNL